MEHIFTCKICSAASHLKFHISEYIKHLKIFHAHQPDSDDNNFDSDQPYYDDNVETDGNQQCSSRSTIQKSSALFLLGIKQKFKLTQSTVNVVVQGVTAMNQHHISILKSQVSITDTSYIAKYIICT